jgi:UDP-N-acetylmuramoylalanine--D-glutamate ligase
MHLPPNTSLIVGLGKTGLSCVRYLVKQKQSVAVVDTRNVPPGIAELRAEFPQVPVYLGSLPAEILLQAKQLIVSPGLSLHEPAIAQAIQQGIPALGDIELFARKAKAPVIAITGTNAKGTVTTLVGEMLRAAGRDVRVGGNIGTPALDLLMEKEPEFYVLELSSFQLETTSSLHARAAAILNISADHLDRYNSVDSYAAAKQRIYHNCEVMVYNRDDSKTTPNATYKVTPKNTLSFGLNKPAVNEFGIEQNAGRFWLAFGSQQLLPVDELLIKGRHNWANALAALALGYAVGLPFDAMLVALRTFKGLAHRCEWVLERNGVNWYNDSKGTNVGATLAAIQGLGSAIVGKLILIAGGLGKGADFSPLQTAVTQFVRTVILLGEDAPLFKKALAPTARVIGAATLQEAVILAQQEAKLGDCVLLSPACASFDMFRNAEERGEIFKAAVRGLSE